VDKKAPQKTLQAFEAMRKKVPEARLVMVGDGPLLKDCRQWVRQQGIEDAVTFTGVLSRRAVSRLLSTSRAFVQHSVVAPDGDREGLPLAILEAGAHGLPMIATRHAGIPDAVREAQDGFLVDEGDIKAMALAMWKLAAKPDLAASMGKSFRGRVAAEYSRKVSIERLQRLLGDLARREPPKPHAKDSRTTSASEKSLEEQVAHDRNNGHAMVELGKREAGEGNYAEAYLYLKEAERVGALAEKIKPMLQALEANPELQTDEVKAYQSAIGVGGFGKTENPRRVLVFTNLLPPQEMGGFGRTVWEFCDGLMQRGHEVKVLTADVKHLEQEPYPGYERVERHVDRSLQLFGDWQNGVAQDETDMAVIQRKAVHNVRTILEAVKRFKPDICMAGNLDFLSGAMLDPILKQKIPIVHRLGNANPGYAADGTPESPLYCIAGCSNWVNEELQRNGYKAGAFAVLPAGAPLHEYYRLVPPAFDTLRICYAGLVMGYKGPHLLVEALGMLKKLGVSFSCEIAGDMKDPNYAAAFKSLIAKQGLREEVRLLGFQNRKGLAAMYSRCNTLVFPSVFEEPFGKVQIEAQAAGLAVVRSAVGGYADMLEDEVNGLLFKPNDAEDLARQLYVLQGKPDLWARLAARGQADAFRFTTRNCVELLEEIMEAMLGKRG
jgi:glycosyltransferase involved in cell wall biosynthesis